MAFLYLTEQGSVLKKKGERLVVEKDGETLLDIGGSKIDGVLVFGNIQFTTQAVRMLLKDGIELALFTSRGRLLGQITPPAARNIVLRQAQYARHGEAPFVLDFARTIVAGKTSNALELLREFQHNHPETDLSQPINTISALRTQIDAQIELSALNGLEGAAAKAYFAGFAQMIRHSFSFQGRARHPSPDPVNAMLSLGYTMVYNEISSLLDGMGLDPYLGYYHQPHYGHATLASDVMEEFRSPLVDRFTLYLVNNKIFKEDDFYLHGPSGSVYLKDEPRKRYFYEYERFINRPMRTVDDKTDRNFRELFRRQAERVRKAVQLEDPYVPYLFRW